MSSTHSSNESAKPEQGIDGSDAECRVFGENDFHGVSQKSLEIYGLIGPAAAHETV